MTETSHEGPQYREPGVNYRRERRTRQVTTVIDGTESTHEEDYYVDVPVPPRDWETLIQRALFAWAAALVIVAFVGTCASVGGLFSELLHPGVAYLLGLVFTGSWLGCMGLEWLDGRIDPARATAARAGGWFALLLGMGAVFVYGHSKGLPWVGAVGACLDLLAKGFCTLLLRRYQVKLPKGVATWVRHQEEREAGRAVLAEKIGRLNRYAAYRRAVGGREHQAAQAMLAAAETTTRALPDTSGQAAPVSAPVSGQTQAQAPAPPVTPAGTGTSGSSEQQDEPEPQQDEDQDQESEQGDRQGDEQDQTGTPPNLQPVGPLSIAAAVRQARTEDPEQSDADMVARVLELRGGNDGGDRVKFTDTVTRTRRRQESKERKAS